MSQNIIYNDDLITYFPTFVIEHTYTRTEQDLQSILVKQKIANTISPIEYRFTAP